ncbi:zinc ribbon domain-containing protein, partial [Streptomyces sp. AC154]
MRACPTCGASNGSADDFCGNCGAYLGWSETGPAPGTPPANTPAPPEPPAVPAPAEPTPAQTAAAPSTTPH